MCGELLIFDTNQQFATHTLPAPKIAAVIRVWVPFEPELLQDLNEVDRESSAVLRFDHPKGAALARALK